MRSPQLGRQHDHDQCREFPQKRFSGIHPRVTATLKATLIASAINVSCPVGDRAVRESRRRRVASHLETRRYQTGAMSAEPGTTVT